MKLDRNLNANGRGKYGLILNRKLAELDHIVKDETASAYARLNAADALQAIITLESAGILDWGDTADTEFFVIRLRDRYAGRALASYAASAWNNDNHEYAEEVRQLGDRAGLNHPSFKVPD